MFLKLYVTEHVNSILAKADEKHHSKIDVGVRWTYLLCKYGN